MGVVDADVGCGLTGATSDVDAAAGRRARHRADRSRAGRSGPATVRRSCCAARDGTLVAVHAGWRGLAAG